MKNQGKNIRVMLVDDHIMMLDGLKSLLDEESEVEVVCAVSSGEAALKELKSHNIDIVVADIHLPGMNGIELTKKLGELHPEVKVLSLTMHNEASMIHQMLQAGAWGYVVKSNNINELVDAIRIIYSGKKFLSRDVQSIVIDTVLNPDDVSQDIHTHFPKLTNRELEILNLIAREFSNKDIAEKLFISERTVETHRKNIFTKTKTRTVVGLIRYAIENNLISQ